MHRLRNNGTRFKIERPDRISGRWGGMTFAPGRAMATKNLLFFILASFSVNAFAWHVQQVDNPDWLASLKAEPSVYSEMNKYFKKVDPSRDATEYVQQFIPAIHQAMVIESLAFMQRKLAQPGCTPSTEVAFPEQLSPHPPFASVSGFEGHFLKIKSYACLGKLNLDKVFETLMSEDFQRKAISGLQDIRLDQVTNKACVQTKIFGLGTSNYCLTKRVQKTENQYIIQSFNEQNIGNPDAPIYFKETINVITRLANGEISLYNLMYARSVDLSFRGIVQSRVKDRQDDVRKYLIEGASR